MVPRTYQQPILVSNLSPDEVIDDSPFFNLLSSQQAAKHSTMLSRPNSAPLSRALSIIMLVVQSTMEMAMVDGLSEDALHTIQSSDTLHVDLTPLASRQKRYLRSAADVTITSTGEVRRLAIHPEDLHVSLIPGEQNLAFSVKLRQSFSKITSKIMARIRVQWWLWFNKQKTPEDAFESLRLDKDGVNPFKNPKFPAWKYFVEKTTPKKEDVTKAMFEAMFNTMGGKGNLAKILYQAKSSPEFRDTVQSLYDYQINQWAQTETAQSVYDFLGLGTINTYKLSDSPEFAMWGAFVDKTGYKGTFRVIRQNRDLSSLLNMLAGIHPADDNFKVAQGLIYFHLQYRRDHNGKPEQLYEHLRPGMTEVTIPEVFVDDQWLRILVDFVYMQSRGKDGFTTAVEVFNKLKLMVGDKIALLAIVKVETNGHFLKVLSEEGRKMNSDTLERLLQTHWKMLEEVLRNWKREDVEELFGKYVEFDGDVPSLKSEPFK